MQASLIDRFLAGVRINPAVPAILADGRVISHQQVQSLVGATARRLHDEGKRAGAIVGVSMEQGPLHCVAVLALARLGVLSVPIAPTMAPAVRDRQMRVYAIEVLVANTLAAGFRTPDIACGRSVVLGARDFGRYVGDAMRRLAERKPCASLCC